MLSMFFIRVRVVVQLSLGSLLRSTISLQILEIRDACSHQEERELLYQQIISLYEKSFFLFTSTWKRKRSELLNRGVLL